MRPRLRTPIQRFLHARTHAVVAVSLPVAASLQRVEGLAAARVTVIPNAIDTDRFVRQRSREECRRMLGKIPMGPWVGMIGRARREKGGDLFVAALPALFRNHPMSRALLVGDGPALREWRAMAADLGIAERIWFAGSQTDVRPYLHALDLLVIPSRQESFGVVALEAFASGCPVLATRVGGLPEVLDEGRRGLLVEAGNTVALADGMLACLSDPEAMARRSEEAFRRVREDYGPAAAARRHLELYASLAAGGGT